MKEKRANGSEDEIRILYIDDKLDQLEFAKLFLEEAEPAFQVELVSSTVEALNMLNQPFDCIISDYQMWGIDVFELYRKLREHSQAPFILYTGRGSEEVAEAAFAAGIDDYVRKDVDPSHYKVLAKRIRTSVERHRAQEEIRLLSNVVQQTSEGIAVSNLEGRLVFANQAWAKMHGYELKELMGEAVSIFYNRREVERSLGERVRSEGSIRVRIGHVRKDGMVFPTLATWTLLKDEKDEPLGIVRITKDLREIIRDIRDVKLLKETSRENIEFNVQPVTSEKIV